LINFKFFKHKHHGHKQNSMTQKGPNANNEKVLVIGNRLANMNAYRKNDLEQLNTSHDALETLIQPSLNNNTNNLNNSIKKTPLSNNSLHVDSAVSMSGVSQQSILPAVTSSPVPPQPQTPPAPPRDDAQMVDFLSSFLFPISFIIFNIIYWMVYLNMQILSTN
jgi:hypothetical protein